MPAEQRDPVAAAVPVNHPAPWWKALGDRVGHSVLARYVARFLQADLLALAASLSYFTLISLAPLVTMLLWVTTLLYPAAQAEFLNQIGLLAGREVESTVRTVMQNVEQQERRGTLAPVIGAVTLVLGATVVFGQLQVALNRIFGESGEKLTGVMAWVRKRLLSFGMIVSLGFLLVISMAVQAGLQMAMGMVPGLWPVLAILITFVIYAVGFAAMYHYLPDCSVRWRRALQGGAITALMFIVGKWAIGLYLGQAELGSAYGPAGGLAVMLVWLYYSAIIVLAGALATAMLDELIELRRGHKAGRSG